MSLQVAVAGSALQQRDPKLPFSRISAFLCVWMLVLHSLVAPHRLIPELCRMGQGELHCGVSAETNSKSVFWFSCFVYLPPTPEHCKCISTIHITLLITQNISGSLTQM